jgi:hypothetical protein
MELRDRRLVALAIAAGLATEEETQYFFSPPIPDPCDGMDDEQRWEYAVAHCASGAPATLPIPNTTIDGHRIAVPAGHRAARGPRGRSPRGKGQAPEHRPLCAPETSATGDGGTGVPTIS